MKVIYGKYSIQIVPENDADMDGKTDNSTTIMRGTKTYQKVGTKVEWAVKCLIARYRRAIKSMRLTADRNSIDETLQIKPCLHRQIK